MEGDFSVYEMPLEKTQGMKRGEVMLWHDFESLGRGQGIAAGWEHKIPEVDSKYTYLADKFSRVIENYEPKMFFVSNAQHNLQEYAASEEDFERKFRLDAEFYFELKHALLQRGVVNFKIVFLNRSLDDAYALSQLHRKGEVSLTSRYVGTLSPGNYGQISNSLIPCVHTGSIEPIVGRYTNGCVIELLADNTAAVYVDGNLWGQAVPYFNGYIFVFKPDGGVWIAGWRDNSLRFNNKTSWVKEKS
ncbi:MAG: hypothetical protein EPN21_09400 [Methylococcaceae bacterium]|nr:MAG: hypothetical protein EPN21_09400 [Methylococcaceae bacterium]